MSATHASPHRRVNTSSTFGFIGCEVAASLRGMGVNVVLVEPQPTPLASVLGEQIGALVARLHQRRLVAVFGHSEALQGRLWLEALRQGIRSAPQVVWLSDGARGLWGLFEECFTTYAMGILDFYHAAQQRWKAATAWLDGRMSNARRWFIWARHRLRHGKPDGVLADLADARDVEGLPPTARDTVRTV